MALYLLWRSERKRAAVGRREMQLLLVGFIIVCICEIFSVGGFLQNHSKVLRAFSAVHIAAITMFFWILFLNALVGYQILDDGTPVSLGLLILSSVIMLVGTGYIALDTAFSWTKHFDKDLNLPNTNIGLYVLYFLVPLVFLAAFFVLETNLVLRELGERRPMSKFLR
jgi:Chitin synthase export chaperone